MTELVAAAPTPFSWLTSDWRSDTVEAARRNARVGVGIVAWLVCALVDAVSRGELTVIGVPLLVLWLLQRFVRPSLLGLAALGCLTFAIFMMGWGTEWPTGVVVFKGMMVLFTARCAWAQHRLTELPTAHETAEVFA